MLLDKVILVMKGDIRICSPNSVRNGYAYIRNLRNLKKIVNFRPVFLKYPVLWTPHNLS